MRKLLKKLYRKIDGNRFVNFDVFCNNIQSKFSIVFAHNILNNHQDMQFLIDKFSDTHNVIAIDFSGHAGSDNLNEYNYDSYLSDCLSVINQANSKYIIWIGQGIGGIIGAKLASHIANPIVGLVAFDCDQFSNNNVSSNDVEYEYNNLIEAKEAIYSKYSDIDRNILDKFSLNKYKVMNEMFVNNYHIGIIAQLDNFFNCDLVKIFNDVRSRALLIGKKDLIDKVNDMDVCKEEHEIKLLHKEEHINLIHGWVTDIMNDPHMFLNQFKKYMS
ncbi:hypothetical protein FZC35_00330 [Candidatus Cytomitobacter indipagum]|uniref:Alpha/beta hydrolase n=1 Tax=Candidatus Cytomitobacter indipagum TaxID=2601575 RepID=A0A5C0UCT7_9PROT|nr:hypothetical protein [Candidatus Cytomitobacter indipagum]QEK37836.1 hypothetical protein FZC35_00330 [Candidatus Cytomitobacter indipagum]